MHRHTPAIHAELGASSSPSLYDEAMRLLARRGFAIAPAHLGRDWRRTHEADRAYARPGAGLPGPARHWDLYELAEDLVDLEDWFRQWRFRHVTTVERIIGHKTGTGGSSGVGYLKRALEVCCFPELWQVRTEL